MKNYIKSKRIANHIFSVMSEDKETDREEFLKWMNENSTSSKCVENLSDSEVLSTKVNNIKSKDKRKSVDTLFLKIAVAEKRRRRLHLFRVGAAVAVCAAVLFVSFNIFNVNSSKLSLSENIIKNKALSQIKPVISKENVILLTGSGDKITLNSEMDAAIANASIKADMDGAAKNGEKVKMPANTIITPKGAGYNFTLSDGSKVWINENSKLIYPVEFDGTIREVILEGEAYFEVKRNENMPFIVRCRDNSSIRVLGTRFNVSCGENETCATLVDGSVEVESTKSKVIIKPSEQAVVNAGDNEIKVQVVDVTLYTAWKDGKFAFRDKPVKDIMLKISQWYNINVYYENESVKDIKLSGMLRKYDTFKEIMEVMEATGLLDIRVENDNNVKVFKKRNSASYEE